MQVDEKIIMHPVPETDPVVEWCQNALPVWVMPFACPICEFWPITFTLGVQWHKEQPEDYDEQSMWNCQHLGGYLMAYVHQYAFRCPRCQSVYLVTENIEWGEDLHDLGEVYPELRQTSIQYLLDEGCIHVVPLDEVEEQFDIVIWIMFLDTRELR